MAVVIRFRVPFLSSPRLVAKVIKRVVGKISCLALDLVAVLAVLEGLVHVGVLGGHEGLDQSSDGGGGEVLGHATELANDLLHA